MSPTRHQIIRSIAALVCTVACSAPNGSLSGTRKPSADEVQRTDANADNTARSDGSANTANSNDAADQPVQVIGTYLTCAIEERTELAATVGCKVVRRGDSRRVAIQKLTKSYQWGYTIPPATSGTAELVSQTPGDVWHAIYVFKGNSAPALASLLSAVHIIFDAVPLAGQAITSSTHFDAPLDNLIPTGDDLGAAVAGIASAGQVFVPPSASPPLALPSSTATSNAATPPSTGGARTFPTLAGKHYPTNCSQATSGSSDYTIKDTFFGEQDGRHTIGRVIYSYTDTTCAGTPTRTVKSTPEVTFYYFAGETPSDGALAVSYDPASTRVSFYIRMDGDTTDTKVAFATGL